MKPFNIEEAKAGKPVCTRDGKEARIICFGTRGEYPIIAQTDGDDYAHSYSEDGRINRLYQNESDLFMFTAKHVGWVNIYRAESVPYVPSSIVYDTEDEARKYEGWSDYAATVKIEWED